MNRFGAKHCYARLGKKGGFSLVELLVAVTIFAALSAIAIPRFQGYRNESRNAKAISDLHILDNQINSFKMSNETWPSALSQVPQGNMLDPWGHPYRYLQIEGNSKAKGNERKDKNLVPINSDFDLYSMGADGQTASPLTAASSRDDLVRASDGHYYGLAANY
jgi:general secretion pathway protein G